MNHHVSDDTTANILQIKICGITCIEDALLCADLGANAIGFVFYPKSPRYISPGQAKSIIAGLPDQLHTVGVFVDESAARIADIVTACGIGSIQLHGNESPQDVENLIGLGIPIIKALYMKGAPSIENAFLYNATSFLVECEKGVLPGGNALQWKWEDASDFGEHFPFVLAGGLTPENISTAILAAKPDAVDASSGVEIAPGRKDIDKVRQFIKNVKNTRLNKPLRKIFHESSY